MKLGNKGNDKGERKVKKHRKKRLHDALEKLQTQYTEIYHTSIVCRRVHETGVRVKKTASERSEKVERVMAGAQAPQFRRERRDRISSEGCPILIEFARSYRSQRCKCGT